MPEHHYHFPKQKKKREHQERKKVKWSEKAGGLLTILVFDSMTITLNSFINLSQRRLLAITQMTSGKCTVKTPNFGHFDYEVVSQNFSC